MSSPGPPRPSENFPDERQSFETTQWSVVLAAAREGDSSRAGVALEVLCRKYWFPLFAYVRRRGYSAPDAQDLVQGFFARILERNDLQAVRKECGRFRSYLLAALKNFLVNDWKHARAEKRGGGQIPIPLDDLLAARPDVPLPADEQSPDRIFDQQWAIALLERVLMRLRAEHCLEGKDRQFECLQPFLIDHQPTRSQAEIAAEFAMSEGAVKQAVFRLRQRYKNHVRAEVADTVATPDEVDEELRHLIAALRR